MGTKQPDTERMHRLLDEALDHADLTGNVVPGVLAGYEHKVKVRRRQAAGVALGLLATAGVAIGALPHGSGVGSRPTAADGPQSTDYCKHHQWIPAPGPDGGTVVSVGGTDLVADPPLFHTDCEALRTALQAVFPDTQLVPQYNADLALDPRVDQTLVKQVEAEQHTDPPKGDADQTEYFGAELQNLAVHPEDPANIYLPEEYTLVTPAGREALGVSRAVGKADPRFPGTFVGTADSYDCAKMPAALKGSVQCTPVGVAGGWHGALWKTPPAGENRAQLVAVLTNGRGTSIELFTSGGDDEGWYVQGDKRPNGSYTWVNRWTGQTYEGTRSPDSRALTEEQWTRFLGSSAFRKFADVYLVGLSKAGTQPQAVPSPTRSH
jgi:hypothetical protein